MNYNEFIQNILNTRGRFSCGNEYHERHHIVPKCCGGTNEEENLIDLFAREHFIAHRLLALENPDVKGLVYAWRCMADLCRRDMDRYELTAEEYEELKKIHAKTVSESKKGVPLSDEAKQRMRDNHADIRGENNPMFGKHHTEETKQKIREAKQNISDETRCKIGEASKGRKHSDEAKAKISSKVKGANHPNTVQVYCPELDEYFDYINQANEKYNIPKTGITCCLSGRQKTAGKHPITGEPLHWVKVESK